jgi:hypothetical protein
MTIDKEDTLLDDVAKIIEFPKKPDPDPPPGDKLVDETPKYTFEPGPQRAALANVVLVGISDVVSRRVATMTHEGAQDEFDDFKMTVECPTSVVEETTAKLLTLLEKGSALTFLERNRKSRVNVSHWPLKDDAAISEVELSWTFDAEE